MGAVANGNNTIALGVPSAFLAVGGVLMFQAWEAGDDSLTIRACNVSPNGPASKPVNGTIRVDLWKH